MGTATYIIRRLSIAGITIREPQGRRPARHTVALLLMALAMRVGGWRFRLIKEGET